MINHSAVSSLRQQAENCGISARLRVQRVLEGTIVRSWRGGALMLDLPVSRIFVEPKTMLSVAHDSKTGAVAPPSSTGNFGSLNKLTAARSMDLPPRADKARRVREHRVGPHAPGSRPNIHLTPTERYGVIVSGSSTRTLPDLHQLAALVEQIAAPIGGFHSIPDGMGERHLGNLARGVGALRSPIAERRAEAVHGHVTALQPSAASAIAMSESGQSALPPAKNNIAGSHCL